MKFFDRSRKNAMTQTIEVSLIPTGLQMVKHKIRNNTQVLLRDFPNTRSTEAFPYIYCSSLLNKWVHPPQFTKGHSLYQTVLIHLVHYYTWVVLLNNPLDSHPAELLTDTVKVNDSMFDKLQHIWAEIVWVVLCNNMKTLNDKGTFIAKYNVVLIS